MKQTKQRTHKVTYAHRKSYRKRHYLALTIVIGLLLIAATNAITYELTANYQRNEAAESANVPIAPAAEEAMSQITSSYGFSVDYDSNKYYASAVDNTSGGLHIGAELETDRTYESVRLSTIGYGQSEAESLSIRYIPDVKEMTDLNALEAEYVAKVEPGAAPITKASSEPVTLNGTVFQRSLWYRPTLSKPVALNTSFATYTAVVSGSPLIMTVYTGVTIDAPKADELAKMLRTSERTTNEVSYDPSVLKMKTMSINLLDFVLNTKLVGAEAPSYTGSERISATYNASIVKVYNVYAADLAIDGQVVMKDWLSGGTGSGFIVSSTGDVATNGHVVVNDPKDTIISVALSLAATGDTAPFNQLVQMANILESDVAGATSDQEAVRIIIEKLYDIDDARFTFVNEKTNLLVGLADKQVDIEELLQQTSDRKDYAEQSTIKRAKLVSFDYGSSILASITGTFEESDVALIKLSGTGYPNVRLGEVGSLSQGANLNIIGFPGVASGGNGLVDKTQTIATLTTGKVSSIKKDTRGKTLIETDTEIGHGNSGGPAFDDDGNVVGIATYTSDTGQAGDGVLNYVRDIADFKDLADKSSVDYETISDTQLTWNKGIDKFYDAHYKSAVKYFEEVKEAYPAHPKAAELIATSEKRIAEGKNIDEFPVVGVLIGGIVLLFVIGGVVVFFIIRHNKTHKVYQGHVNAGVAAPLTPGAQPQFIQPLQPQTPFGAPAVQQQTFAPQQQPQAQPQPQQPFATPVQPQPVQNPVQPTQQQQPDPNSNQQQ